MVTLFPEMFEGPLTSSIIGRARQSNRIEIDFVNPRDFATDKHRSVDAAPYGGGPGMVMMAPPLTKAVETINAKYADTDRPLTILMSPQGRPMTHQIARRLSQLESLTIVCGHYEGVDERFIETCVDSEISIGDFILTGGEIPAMAVIDAVARLVPGVVGDSDSVLQESFSKDSHGMLEGPIYTRPPEFRGVRVPEVLLTGNRHEIERFRTKKAAERTLDRRPDLMQGWGPEPPSGD